MSNLNSLLESSNQWKHMQSDAARLASKWDKTGLLEGLGTETEKNNMSLILENQAKQLVVESSQTGGGAGSAGTFTAGQGEQWAGIALPLVRKVFGQIAAKDFVSVQPMSLPSGLVFFLDFQYGGGGSIEGQGGKFTTGSGVFGASSVYGDTDTSDAPKGGLYGAGRWTYSTNVTESVIIQENYDSASATFGEIGYNSVISASLAGGGNPSIYKLTISASSLPNADKEAARSIQVVKGTGDADLIDMVGYVKRFPKFGDLPILFMGDYADEDPLEVLEMAFEDGYDVVMIDSLAEVAVAIQDFHGGTYKAATSKILTMLEEQNMGENKRGVNTSSLLIQQVTKSGAFAGSNRIKHMTTAMGHIKFDSEGGRYLAFSKNRRGGNMNKFYFNLNTKNMVNWLYEAPVNQEA